MRKEMSYHTKSRYYDDFDFVETGKKKSFIKGNKKKLTKNQLKCVVSSGTDWEDVDDIIYELEVEYGDK